MGTFRVLLSNEISKYPHARIPPFSNPYDLDLPVFMDDELLWKELLTVQQEELLFDVYVYPESGELVQVRQLSSMPRRTRRLRNLFLSTGSTVVTLIEAATPNFVIDARDRKSTAPGRAFHQVRRRMFSQSLITHARVAYDVALPMKTIKRDISKFVTRLRKTYKGMPYVAVFERGEITGLMHWHIALPYYVSPEAIGRCWIRGSTHVSHMQDVLSLEKFVSYITKTFFKDDYIRDFPHRYKKDKVTIIIRTHYEGLTQADVEMLVEKMAEDNPNTLRYKEPNNEWIAGSYRWQPVHLSIAFDWLAQHI